MEFNEEQQYINTYDDTPKGIKGWLIKRGVVKDSKGANMIMLISLVIIVAITLLLFNSGSGGQESGVPEQPAAGIDDPNFTR